MSARPFATFGVLASERVDGVQRLMLLAGALVLSGLTASAIWLGLQDPLAAYPQWDPALGIAGAVLGVVGMLLGSRAWHRLRHEASATLLSAEHMTRFHAVLSETNRLILRRPEPAELFEGVCESCVSAGHTELAVIDLVGGGDASRVVAEFDGREGGGTSTLRDGLARSRQLHEHLVRLAMQSDEPLVINDMSADARVSAWQAPSFKSEVNAMAAIPLKRAGTPVGALLLCSTTKAFFVDSLLPLLSEMGADLSFALDNSDRENARRAAQDQVERRDHLFQTLFAAAPVPMAIFTLQDRKAMRVNSLWCSLVGLAPDRPANIAFDAQGFWPDAGEREHFYSALRATERVIGMQTRWVSSDGTHHDVLVNAHVVDYLGKSSFLVVATDVSEMKAAQVADSAREVAEEANRAKTEFLARMSHELRTPLNAILGFAQLLASDTRATLSQEQADQVGLITHAGWHLLGLVNDVMDISRIESGQLEALSEPTDIAGALDEAMALCHPLAHAQQVDLRKQVGVGTGVGVLADPRRLRQVLINLLSNACKYNRPGGTVRVEVSASETEVVFDVIDNGVGMSAEQLSHLFEPFNRLGQSEHTIEGTGIGLTLSRQLVEMMKGRLEVESNPTTGTRARLVLPACELRQEHFAAVTGPPAVGRILGGSTVLYIEDNEVNQILVQQMIARCSGVTLMQAETGEDGLAFALLQQPDLILLDMQLPDMSGYEVLRALRGDSRTKALRVVAVSASAMPDAVAAAVDLGVLDYWTKPLELNHFLAGITAILRLQHAGAGAADRATPSSAMLREVPVK